MSKYLANGDYIDNGKLHIIEHFKQTVTTPAPTTPKPTTPKPTTPAPTTPKPTTPKPTTQGPALQSTAAMQSTRAMQSTGAMQSTTAMQSTRAMQSTSAMQTARAMQSTEAMQSARAMQSTGAMQSTIAMNYKNTLLFCSNGFTYDSGSQMCSRIPSCSDTMCPIKVPACPDNYSYNSRIERCQQSGCGIKGKPTCNTGIKVPLCMDNSQSISGLCTQMVPQCPVDSSLNNGKCVMQPKTVS